MGAKISIPIRKYAGGESYTFNGGLIIKQGSEALATGTEHTITFATAFPNACVGVFLTHRLLTTSPLHTASAHTLTAANFKLWNSSDAATWSWLAIGY